VPRSLRFENLSLHCLVECQQLQVMVCGDSGAPQPTHLFSINCIPTQQIKASSVQISVFQTPPRLPPWTMSTVAVEMQSKPRLHLSPKKLLCFSHPDQCPFPHTAELVPSAAHLPALSHEEGIYVVLGHLAHLPQLKKTRFLSLACKQESLKNLERDTV
jgi:hypothetical protein